MSATERMVLLRVRGLDCWAVSGLGCGSLIAPTLARIADVAPDARTDHSGELLRFVDRGQTDQVRIRLNELGYQSELLGDVDARSPVDWYSPDDLSREEAQVLSARLVAEFVRKHSAAAGVTAALTERLEDALFARFTSGPVAAAAPSRPGRGDAVAAATSDLVGPATARALGRYVDAWLERR